MRTHVVAKTIVFNSAGQLLVLRRSADDDHRPRGSDFPGGRVEEGEAIVEGALREALEESGLQLKAADMQLAFAATNAGYNNEQQTDINIVWLGFVTRLPESQTVQLSHEHQGYSWLGPEDALADCDGPTQKRFLVHIRDYDLMPHSQSLGRDSVKL